MELLCIQMAHVCSFEHAHHKIQMGLNPQPFFSALSVCMRESFVEALVTENFVDCLKHFYHGCCGALRRSEGNVVGVCTNGFVLIAFCCSKLACHANLATPHCMTTIGERSPFIGAAACHSNCGTSYERTRGKLYMVCDQDMGWYKWDHTEFFFVTKIIATITASHHVC